MNQALREKLSQLTIDILENHVTSHTVLWTEGAPCLSVDETESGRYRIQIRPLGESIYLCQTAVFDRSGRGRMDATLVF